MRISNEFVETANYRRLVSALEALRKRPAQVPGVGIVYGPEGMGKTLSMQRLYANDEALMLVTAREVNSLKSFLEAVLRDAMGVFEPRGTIPQLFDQVVDKLDRDSVLIIDEADYVAGKHRLLNVVKDIYNATGCAILLFGTDQMVHGVMRNAQFNDRVSQRVVFKGLTAGDVKLVFRTLADLDLDDDAAAEVARHTRGHFRKAVNVLVKCVEMADTNKLKRIGLEVTKAAEKQCAFYVDVRNEWRGRSKEAAKAA